MAYNFAHTVDARYGTFTEVHGPQYNYANPRSVFDILEHHAALNAAYNSLERESEHASICQERTRVGILEQILAWSRADNGHPICWLQGAAGSGKSTIAHTIAKQCADDGRLAFSFFFSRGKQNRSDTTRFFSTLAYQLAKSFPAVQTSMLQVLVDDPSIVSQRLRDQMMKLIIGPLLAVQGPIPSMIAVIDGLDECGEEVLLQELIHLLVETANQLPFRFLFSSRPEIHIEQMFEYPLTKSKTEFLSLRDFSALDDVREYLRQHLSEVYEKENQLMRDVPRPWPSQTDLEVLVTQSEGLFIYVSTLVNFVSDGYGHPQDKLQAAMKTHSGLDPLYDTVLFKAQKFESFERVVGTIIYLRKPLILGELGQLLQLSSSHVRLALRGCQSIFTIPQNDVDSVRPFHASLRDFLTELNRAKGHFLDPKIHHVFIVVDCLKSIATHVDNGEIGGHLEYACQNWCYHVALALLYQGEIGDNMVIFMEKMERQWLKLWMYQLVSFEGVKTVHEDCKSALVRLADVTLSSKGKAIKENIMQIQKVVNVSTQYIG